ncbi:MAG: hypothetical protein NC078_10345 [Ruminococcus sp.]|nr:hypothetical protein [Ruminococcus sp.]
MAEAGKIIYRILGDNSNLAAALDKVGTLAGKAAVGIGKISLAATGAAATAVAALSKAAIDSYAEYEQLVGGVETLFDKSAEGLANSADTVKRYADEAYRSAGMSANQYMETVTGFSASLLQGLGNDTAAAAEIANMAVIDMADNANKMGSNMQDIQNAYQGFAKQNFTMLDNLKLGYGGTQAEMQRLLDRAEELTGRKFDISNFADIAEAIHAVQTDLKISGLSIEEADEAVAKGLMTQEEAQDALGTTAKEAATTIQGSMSMLKASWANLMTGMADPTQDFDRLIGNVVSSVETVVDNLMTTVMAVLPQMAAAIIELADNILPMIPETLEQLLPAVLEGANALIEALLETLSQTAQTAIPIISDNAGTIVETLMTSLTENAPMLITAALDLVDALVTAIVDNIGLITQGALDIVYALADGISEHLPELIPAAVEALLIFADTLVENIDEILEAAEELITALADGLINSLPTLLEKAPEIITKLLIKLLEAIPDTIEFAVELCERIGETLVNFDWSAICDNAYHNLQAALYSALNGGKDMWEERAKREQENIDKYKNLTVEEIDRTKNNLTKKLGELNLAATEANKNGAYDYDLLPEWIRRGIEGSGKTAGEYIEWYKNELTDQISDLETARQYAVHEMEKTAQELEEAGEDFENSETESDNKENGNSDNVPTVNTSSLENELEDLENLYATHKVTEEQYWADRKAILEKYRDDNDPEWWELYDKVTDHYDKLAETEKKEAENAAKEAEQAARDYENSVKQSIQDKFRDLETEQLEKGYSDEWLLTEKEKFLETLDHNSEAYKDYHLKLLQEQNTANEKALKEAQTAADKAKDALEKSYDSIIESRDSLAESLNNSGDIFKVSDETDKRTGEKKKSQSIGLDDYKKKVEAKKKLTGKIAALLEQDMPMEFVKDLLKQDPEEALKYANELLKSPKKLSELKKTYAEDEGVSNILANMVTENSDEFKDLGTQAGEVFGESFSEAFKENWEEALKNAFDDNAVTAAAVTVSTANQTAGMSTAVSANTGGSDNTAETAGKKSANIQTVPEYAFVYLDGQMLGKIVRQENKKYNTMGGS